MQILQPLKPSFFPSLCHVFFALQHSLIINGHDASKSNCFGLFITSPIQGISRWVPLASIHHKCNTSPLPSQLAQVTLLQVFQYLDIWDEVQSVLDSFQVGHLVTTTHSGICIQAAHGILVQCQDQVDLCILLGYARILGILLKLLGKLLHCCAHLLHCSHAQM